MQPNRGDELVVAGMRPNSLAASNSVFDRIHRGTTFIVFIDGLIVMYLFWAITSLILPQFSDLSARICNHNLISDLEFLSQKSRMGILASSYIDYDCRFILRAKCP